MASSDADVLRSGVKLASTLSYFQNDNLEGARRVRQKPLNNSFLQTCCSASTMVYSTAFSGGNGSTFARRSVRNQCIVVADLIIIPDAVRSARLAATASQPVSGVICAAITITGNRRYAKAISLFISS
ncbi:hypothetical protein TNCV_3580011 [Trichonephila clavipes]|nr:hypothetical protein TNCV_3580011 [Trichonephila clavipes]